MIMKCARNMLNKGNGWEVPFADGHTAERIVNIVEAECGLRGRQPPKMK
jgi:hypothetical protein